MFLKSLLLDKFDANYIYCYEKTDTYITELKVIYPDFSSKILAFFDDFKRIQGTANIGNRDVPVLPTEAIKTIDWTKATLLITSDYFYEAFEKIQKICAEASNEDASFSCPETVYYYANHETEIDLAYREKYKDDELQDVILFRSGPHASSYVKGMDFADNARALFEYMLEQGYNEKYELVWVVKHPEEFASYAKYPNVKFISFDWSTSDNQVERDEYYRVLCLAKYIFFTDAYGIARNARKDQIRVQLWHGCGFKTRTNFVPCEKRYEYNIVIGDIYKKIHADIYGLREDQVLITGYPKTDWLYQGIETAKLKQLGIPKAGKYIFWLPTFRAAKASLSQLNEATLVSETGLPIVTSGQQLQEINEFLLEQDMVMIIKLHPFQNRDAIVCKDMSNIVLLDNEQLVDRDVQINQLLSVADAMISDYSSAAVDYLLLNRPIAFTLDDVAEYENSRGFVFDNIRDWLPGKEIYHFKDFMTYLDEIAKSKDSTKQKREDLRNKMHLYQDGNSCQRVLDALHI